MSSALTESDKLVQRFNDLNAAVVSGLPEMARAYEVLYRHIPMLREMQALLSQRPAGKGSPLFTMLEKDGKKTKRVAIPVGNQAQLPTWTQWLTAYARAIDYSVRHIRRLVLDEGPKKIIKECGWSKLDHDRLIAAATAGYDLVNAIEAGADTAAICEEIKGIMKGIPDDLIENEWTPCIKPIQKKRPQRITL
jgi:hypothetical protein